MFPDILQLVSCKTARLTSQSFQCVASDPQNGSAPLVENGRWKPDPTFPPHSGSQRMSKNYRTKEQNFGPVVMANYM